MKRHRTPLLQVSKRDGKDVAAGKKSPKKRKKIIKKNEKNVENVKIETLQLPTEKRQYRREADHAKLANEVDLMKLQIEELLIKESEYLKQLESYKIRVIELESQLEGKNPLEDLAVKTTRRKSNRLSVQQLSSEVIGSKEKPMSFPSTAATATGESASLIIDNFACLNYETNQDLLTSLFTASSNPCRKKVFQVARKESHRQLPQPQMNGTPKITRISFLPPKHNL